jgi:hypothetical protein
MTEYVDAKKGADGRWELDNGTGSTHKVTANGLGDLLGKLDGFEVVTSQGDSAVLKRNQETVNRSRGH